MFPLFSASDFTKPAEKYAYAQDSFLVPFAKSAYLQQVLTAIGQLRMPRKYKGKLKKLRADIRRRLLGSLKDAKSLSQQVATDSSPTIETWTAT